MWNPRSRRASRRRHRAVSAHTFQGETMADLCEMAHIMGRGDSAQPGLAPPPSLPFSSKCWLPPRGVGSQHLEEQGREGGGEGIEVATGCCSRIKSSDVCGAPSEQDLTLAGLEPAIFGSENNALSIRPQGQLMLMSDRKKEAAALTSMKRYRCRSTRR